MTIEEHFAEEAAKHARGEHFAYRGPASPFWDRCSYCKAEPGERCVGGRYHAEREYANRDRMNALVEREFLSKPPNL